MAELDWALVIARLVDKLQKPPTVQDWNRLAEQVSYGFNARRDEVAILRISSDSAVLNFVFPIKLASIGAIPLSATYSLATRTVRDKRGQFVNNFSAYRHLTVFEAVDLSENEKAVPIQKIMSSPIVADGRVVGVIQISRKGRAGEPVGPDFTQADLAQLASVGSILGRFIADLPRSPAPFSKPPAQH
jgi:hypothetical protein